MPFNICLQNHLIQLENLNCSNDMTDLQQIQQRSLTQPENLNGSNDMTDLQQIQQRSFNTTRKVEWIK